jgi:membrane-bound serine protease (ClpP class)
MTSIALLIALMTCGIVLLIAEIAIIPGFGVAGLSSILMIGGGAVLAWVKFGPTWGMGSLLLAGAATWGVLVVAPRTRAGRQLILNDALPKPASNEESLLGKEGVAQTPLRPAGVAELEGRRVDVVTDGVFVAARTPVKVVSVEGARIVVAPVSSEKA